MGVGEKVGGVSQLMALAHPTDDRTKQQADSCGTAQPNPPQVTRSTARLVFDGVARTIPSTFLVLQRTGSADHVSHLASRWRSLEGTVRSHGADFRDRHHAGRVTLVTAHVIRGSGRLERLAECWAGVAEIETGARV